MEGVGSDVDKCGQGGFDCTETSTTQLCTKACHAGMCCCMAILITRTVTALAVVNGSLSVFWQFGFQFTKCVPFF